MPPGKPAIERDGAFVISRVFDALLADVWQAWSIEDEMQAWWGPKGCRIEVARFEFRPGGFFHYAMHFSNGEPMWGRFIYREIVPHKRIAWLNSFSNEGCGIARAPFEQAIPLEILNEATMTEKGGRTTVTLRATPHGAAPNEAKVFEGMFASLEQGYDGTLDQLAGRLAKR